MSIERRRTEQDGFSDTRTFKVGFNMELRVGDRVGSSTTGSSLVGCVCV
jgi:hypothetical protein